jgi:hypothetical protein
LKRWSTGNYKSRKSGEIYKYKSSWEAIYMDALDSNPDILAWSYEPVYVCYLHGTKVKRYIPDFIIETKSGVKILVEVKPTNLRSSTINSNKRQAVLQKCEEEKWEYYLDETKKIV